MHIESKKIKTLAITIAFLLEMLFAFGCNMHEKAELTCENIFDKEPLICSEIPLLPSTYSQFTKSEKLGYVKNDFKNVITSLDKKFSFSNGDYFDAAVVKDGIKCYFDNEGNIIRDIRDYKNFNKYAIAVNRKMATTTVYGYDDTCESIIYEPLVSFPCSTNVHLTRIGEFLTYEKYDWHLMYHDYYAKYCTRFDGNILFHSIPYSKKNDDTLDINSYNGILDNAQSAGCVRLRAKDAYYLYKEIPMYTVVVVYDGSLDSPLGRPTFEKIEIDKSISTISEISFYDPTDPIITGKW